MESWSISVQIVRSVSDFQFEGISCKFWYKTISKGRKEHYAAFQDNLFWPNLLKVMIENKFDQ